MISDLLKLFANLDCRLCKKIPYQNVRYNKEITTFYTYLLLQLEDNKIDILDGVLMVYICNLLSVNIFLPD